MTRVAKIFFALALLLAVGGCDGRIERVDGGGIILQITEWNGVPVSISVNAQTLVQVDEIVVSNFPKQPGGTTSTLMNADIVSYEVSFTRADAGTRIPTAYVAGAGGHAPVNGSDTFGNLVILSRAQLENTPLSDLLFENGGIDTETGEDHIVLNVRIRFFGRTLSGDEVESNVVNWTIEFTP